jgi:hypothetical protein
MANDPEGARETIRSALGLSPMDPHTLATKAWTDFVEGRMSEARENARAALAIDPQEELARLVMRHLLSPAPRSLAWYERALRPNLRRGRVLAHALATIPVMGLYYGLFRMIAGNAGPEGLLVPTLTGCALIFLPLRLLPDLLHIPLVWHPQGRALLRPRQRSALIVLAALLSGSLAGSAWVLGDPERSWVPVLLLLIPALFASHQFHRATGYRTDLKLFGYLAAMGLATGLYFLSPSLLGQIAGCVLLIVGLALIPVWMREH